MPARFLVFISVWIALGVGSFIYFRTSKDVAAKRRFHRALVFVSGGLFLFFAWWAPQETGPGFPPLVFLFIVPAVVAISMLNLYLVKFCPGCGAMLYQANWFVPMNHCQACGSKL